MKANSTIRTPADSAAQPLGVVLSGGASRRMQTDKALLEIERDDTRHTLLGWAVHRVLQVASEVVVMDGGRGHLEDSRLHGLGPVEALPDGPGDGPAAGLLGAWAHAPDRPLLVLASDLPNVTPDLLRTLTDAYRSSSADWVLTRTGQRLHPLCAIYGPAVHDELEVAVRSGRRGLWSLYDRSRLHRLVLESPALAAYGDPELLLLNVNTSADYRSLPGARRSEA